jgi:hypothetical protein
VICSSSLPPVPAPGFEPRTLSTNDRCARLLDHAAVLWIAYRNQKFVLPYLITAVCILIRPKFISKIKRNLFKAIISACINYLDTNCKAENFHVWVIFQKIIEKNISVITGSHILACRINKRIGISSIKPLYIMGQIYKFILNRENMHVVK